MQIKSSQDVATGLLFVVVGLGALWIGADYSMGTTQRPGTGVLPRILSLCLIVTGVLIWIRAYFAQDGDKLAAFAWRPLIIVTIATVAFGLFVDTLGFVVTSAVSLTICALATSETRWVEFFVFLAFMILLGWATFIWLLGMPIPTFPQNVAGALSWN